MKITVNYPKANSIEGKKLIENIALYKAILIKESINSMNINIDSKKKILNEIFDNLKNNDNELL